MSDPHDRASGYEDLAHGLAAAARAVQLYTSGHPIITRALTALEECLRPLHAHEATVTLGFLGGDIIGGDAPLARASATLHEFVDRMESHGIERVAFDRGVTRHELARLVDGLAALTSRSVERADTSQGDPQAIVLPHLRAGRVLIDCQSGEDGGGDAAARRLYGDAVAAAESVWESARIEHRPDLRVARDTIDGLVEALIKNRAALLGLTAMKQYDNYTFTHMVNVAILAVGQARGLGIDGRLLRDVGVAGLMHDIGKVRTPLDVLTKPDRLDDAELAVMRRHVVDGAEMLRRTPDMPALAPVVAFEHHLRPDGSGYPDTVRRSSLNLGTLLCSIADVYDAMRSKRAYQQAQPTDRILAVFRGQEGAQFDQHLVRRFVQLLGIYPPGTLVRLSTGETAVVLRTHAPQPSRPAVRVLLERDGARSRAYDLNLWEAPEGDRDSVSVVSALDPADVPVDPLAYL